MKHFVKISLFLIITVFCIEANAQTFALKAGLNLAKMLEKDDEETYSDDAKSLMGFHVGAVVDIPLSDVLSFEPGLILSTKGVKFEEDFLGETITAKSSLYYVDIPLNFKAGFEIGDGMKLYGAVGPYVGVGVSGKIKVEGGGEEFDESVEWGSDEEKSDLKRLDFGVSAGAGLEVSSFLVGLSYDFGLANISPYTEGGYKTSNRVIKISVGYRFGE